MLHSNDLMSSLTTYHPMEAPTATDLSGSMAMAWILGFGVHMLGLQPVLLVGSDPWVQHARSQSVGLGVDGERGDSATSAAPERASAGWVLDLGHLNLCFSTPG